MTDIQNEWTETDTTLYQEIAAVAVPERTEQLAALLTLLPFKTEEEFRVVELGCGQGILATALLDCYSQATVTALDGSPAMRTEAAKRLSQFNGRGRVEPFDLFSGEWLSYLNNADCVLSSLCLHHLDDKGKQELFAAIYQRLSPRGALLIADLVAAQRPETSALFAATWDRATLAQSLAQTKSDALYEKFRQTKWNYYRHPDPFDKPSALFDQLLWLKQAGFAVVDCFWLQAGHAIYGGYKKTAAGATDSLRYELAMHAAREATHP